MSVVHHAVAAVASHGDLSPIDLPSDENTIFQLHALVCVCVLRQVSGDKTRWIDFI